MDVSIIIVSWNTREVTRACLASIKEQTAGIVYETIVIDNNSADGSQEMVANEFPEVILVANKDNVGFAAANNQGMEIARGRYLLLINSDTIVLDRAIQSCIEFADSKPDAGVVGCRILNQDGSLQPSCFMCPSPLNLFLSATYLYKMFPGNRFFGRELMTWWKHDCEMDVEVIRGCFMLVRKEAFDEVGPMDDSFFMYGEESDWCFRFSKDNWRIVFTPSAQIIHLGGQSSRQVKPQMMLQARSGILQFIRKNRFYPSYLVSCFFMSVWFGIRVVPWLWLAVLGTADSVLVATAYLRGAIKSLGGYKALAVKRD